MNKIVGTVIHGNANGRKVGMPTANLSIENQSIQHGVYAAYVFVDQKKYKSVVNVGNRPTIDNKQFIEAHLLDFNEDLYGKTIEIDLMEYLRPIQKFGDLEEVKKQVDKDIVKTRKIL